MFWNTVSFASSAKRTTACFGQLACLKGRFPLDQPAAGRCMTLVRPRHRLSSMISHISGTLQRTAVKRPVDPDPAVGCFGCCRLGRLPACSYLPGIGERLAVLGGDIGAHILALVLALLLCLYDGRKAVVSFALAWRGWITCRLS